MNNSNLVLIAELGSNPVKYLRANQIYMLSDYVTAAAVAGATHTKVQLFKPEHFPEAEWASKREVEFPRELYRSFVRCNQGRLLGWGASVFDYDATKLAAGYGGFVKLASREAHSIGLYHSVRDQFQRFDSIFFSLPNFTAKAIQLRKSWLLPERTYEVNFIVPLFCIPQYPTPLLKALLELTRRAPLMRKMRQTDSRFGYSSHTTSILDCMFAKWLGATVFEKHFSLSVTDVEAGHSLLPNKFELLARALGVLEGE